MGHRQPRRVYWRRRLVALAVVAAVVALGVGAVRAVSGGHPSATGTATAMRHPADRHATRRPPADPPARADGRGPAHLAPGSDPSVLPGPVLIADKLNNRLLLVSPQGRLLWQFPGPGSLRPGQSFLIPDDAFFTPDGRYVIATQEDDFVISVVDARTGHLVWRFGTPGVSGSGSTLLWNPDDAMMLPDGTVLAADIKNCRIVLIPKNGSAISRQLGQTGSCMHAPPTSFASPNGVFPLTGGGWLVTEINGDWVDALGPSGQLLWSANPPGVSYPSDSNQIGPDRYLTVDYSTPGQVVVFTHTGGLVWRWATGLDHPSIALPLPNGDLLVSDDWNNRVIVLDPRRNRIVWQYGHTGVAGRAPGYLSNPDGVDLMPPFSLLGTHAATMTTP